MVVQNCFVIKIASTIGKRKYLYLSNIELVTLLLTETWKFPKRFTSHFKLTMPLLTLQFHTDLKEKH